MTVQKDTLTNREKVAIVILLFIIKLVNPTGYTHQIDELKKELEKI